MCVFLCLLQHVYDGESALFEDEDTRQFYEQLPDLKAVVPQILYKDSVEAAGQAAAAAAAAKASGDAADAAAAVGDGVTGATIATTTLADDINVEDLERELQQSESMVDAVLGDTDGGDTSTATATLDTDSTVAASPSAPTNTTAATDTATVDDDTDIHSSMKLILDEFLTSLPNCVNREMIDRAANDFCLNLNTKANRKKLSRALFGVHRTRYDLLPFYARLVAILQPCMPDVAIELNTLLKNDFRYHVRKKDQMYIETKLKIVRFMGELVKFGIFPKADALHCMKVGDGETV